MKNSMSDFAFSITILVERGGNGHSCAGRNPETLHWIPAFAGMTEGEI